MWWALVKQGENRNVYFVQIAYFWVGYTLLYMEERFTEEELAEAVVYPVSLTAKQRAEAAAALVKARQGSQEKLAEDDRLLLQLWQLKFQLETYIGGGL